MADTPAKSKTIWIGVATVIVGAIYAYLKGDADPGGATIMIITGIVQIIQRTYTLKVASQ